MNTNESFCNTICTNQIHMAVAELSAFFGAVKELFGEEEARLSAEDWLEESGLMDSDSPPESTSREWAVTIAASARLANRLAAARQTKSVTSTSRFNIGDTHGSSFTRSSAEHRVRESPNL